MRLSNTLRSAPHVALGIVGVVLSVALVAGGSLLGVIRKASWSLDAQVLSQAVSIGMGVWVASVFWLGWAAPLLGLGASRSDGDGPRLPPRWRSRLFFVPPVLHGLFAAVWTGFTILVPKSAGTHHEALTLWLFELAVVAIALLLRRLYLRNRRRLALEQGVCPRCDYPTHRSGSASCPECGEPISHTQALARTTGP